MRACRIIKLTEGVFGNAEDGMGVYYSSVQLVTFQRSFAVILKIIDSSFSHVAPKISNSLPVHYDDFAQSDILTLTYSLQRTPT